MFLYMYNIFMENIMLILKNHMALIIIIIIIIITTSDSSSKITYFHSSL